MTSGITRIYIGNKMFYVREGHTKEQILDSLVDQINKDMDIPVRLRAWHDGDCLHVEPIHVPLSISIASDEKAKIKPIIFT